MSSLILGGVVALTIGAILLMVGPKAVVCEVFHRQYHELPDPQLSRYPVEYLLVCKKCERRVKAGDAWQ